MLEFFVFNLTAGEGAMDEASLVKALALDAGLINAHLNLGAILAGRGAHAQAMEHFQLVLKADPQNAVANKSFIQSKAAIANISR